MMNETTERTTYLLIDRHWVASSRLSGHPDLFRIEAITPSASVHYFDWVTTGGCDEVFCVVEASGFKTLRISYTPWNTPFNAFDAWKTHKARAELLKWNLLVTETDPQYLMLIALPGSFSVARLTMLQTRYPDLLIELV
jgi:hypothetical protein